MVLRSGLLWLSERQSIFNFVKRNSLARRLAKRFVAGETLDEALEVARQLNERTIKVSLDLLGESVGDAAQAEAAREQLIEMVERVSDTPGDTNVSIKLTQLGLNLGADVCYKNTRAVLECARERNIFVRLDMEASDYTERTLRLFEERLHPEFGNIVGVVIQSYLHRSAADVERLIEMRARVRLCKGAYSEPAEIAYQSREDVSRAFDSLMQRLTEHGNYPAIATHDEALIESTKSFLRERRIAPERFEFQMLYGVRRDLQDQLLREGFNLRVYVPFGTQWYPYLMRRLAERPANLMFMTMSVVKEAVSGNQRRTAR